MNYPPENYACGCGTTWMTPHGAWTCPRCRDVLSDEEFRSRRIKDVRTGRILSAEEL